MKGLPTAKRSAPASVVWAWVPKRARAFPLTRVHRRNPTPYRLRGHRTNCPHHCWRRRCTLAALGRRWLAARLGRTSRAGGAARRRLQGIERLEPIRLRLLSWAKLRFCDPQIDGKDAAACVTLSTTTAHALVAFEQLFALRATENQLMAGVSLDCGLSVITKMCLQLRHCPLCPASSDHTTIHAYSADTESRE